MPELIYDGQLEDDSLAGWCGGRHDHVSLIPDQWVIALELHCVKLFEGEEFRELWEFFNEALHLVFFSK